MQAMHNWHTKDWTVLYVNETRERGERAANGQDGE